MKIQSINLYQSNALNWKDKTQQESSVLVTETKNHKNQNFELSRLYAVTMPNFKSIQKSDFKFELITTKEIKEPSIDVEIILNKEITTKPGLYAVYSMALNDQMLEEISKNNLKEKGSYIKPEGRKLNLTSTQNGLKNTLKTAKEYFINVKIDSKHIEEAKKLAKVLFELEKVAGYNSTELRDVPKNISVEEFEILVNKITDEDVQKYNSEILKNSNKKIKLYLNTDFYTKNKDEINKDINNLLK